MNRPGLNDVRHSLLVAGLALSIAPIAPAQTTPIGPAAACSALGTLQLSAFALEITGTTWVPEGSQAPAAGPFAPAPAGTLPAYCRVDGVLERRTGADGQIYGIRFALALPVNWNGRFLFQGGSGFNGFVAPPLGPEAAGGRPALARGFAVASTDSGHQSDNPFDATFMREQQASVDFAYRAVGLVTTVAKQIVLRHYARPIDYSYFTGCSTGGREGMLVAQRHPTAFDGIVSGAPAMRTNMSGLAAEWVAVALNSVAPRGTDGRPLTRQAFTESQQRAVVEGILDACDGADGLEDGMIFRMRACAFEPATLVCGGGDECLSAEQARALEVAFAGPRDSRGRQVYPPFPFDAGVADAQGIPGLLHGGLAASAATGMDVDAAAAAAAADPIATLANTAAWTNLNTFSRRGGRLVFYHGQSDPGFSAFDTVDYYERLAAGAGDASAMREWSRLFLVPGMGHCRGGEAALDRVDLLTAVVEWVERGVPPDRVRATGAALPGRSRPLCAYPQYAHYTGRGDPDDADAFECRE